MINIVEEFSEGYDLMKEIIYFFKCLILQEDKTKARKIRLKAARYTSVRGILYKKSFTGPLLRFLMKSEATEVLNAIHFVVCGNHSGGRRLVHKAVIT